MSTGGETRRRCSAKCLQKTAELQGGEADLQALQVKREVPARNRIFISSGA